jgi:tetratricopeptide (TPR) repeat protein
MKKFEQTVATYPAQREMAINGQAYAMLFNREPIDDVINMLGEYAQNAQPTDLTWLNLYRLYFWQESYDKALTAINRVIELTQGARLQEWYVARANLYEDVNDYDAAYKDWETASKVFYVASQYKPWMFTASKMACAYEAGKTSLARTLYQELRKQLRKWSEANDNAQIASGWQEYIDEYAKKMGVK